MQHKEEQELEIDYQKADGTVTTRVIVPQAFYFRSTRFYPEAQWILKAIDLTKGGVTREFAMTGILASRRPQEKTSPEMKVFDPGYDLPD